MMDRFDDNHGYGMNVEHARIAELEEQAQDYNWDNLPEPEDFVLTDGEGALVSLYDLVEFVCDRVSDEVTRRMLPFLCQHEARLEAWLEEAFDWLPDWHDRKIS
jgi:hypothetical protein